MAAIVAPLLPPVPEFTVWTMDLRVHNEDNTTRIMKLVGTSSLPKLDGWSLLIVVGVSKVILNIYVQSIRFA